MATQEEIAPAARVAPVPRTLPPPAYPPEIEFPCSGRVGNRVFKHVVDVDRIGNTLIVYHIEPYNEYDGPSTYFEPTYTVYAQGLTKTLEPYDFHSATVVDFVYDTGSGKFAEYTHCKMRVVGKTHWLARYGSYRNPNWCLDSKCKAGHVARRHWGTYDPSELIEFVRTGPAEIVPHDPPMVFSPPCDPYYTPQAKLLRYVVRRGVLSGPISPPRVHTRKSKIAAAAAAEDAEDEREDEDSGKVEVKRARKEQEQA